ncbi:hypothetical protein [Sinorhizobium mexicanum]|uniref:Uncharacterized protein n=1 Tax=Sinorhizobium mexicanum TaxID=375549 RepID=A0A859QQC4_9HYPH|nr:hypothetical protein [Sinorhizobium mexicanum]MBP1884715.1 hypothetical protein [Sinorhizobium mexicanum]QLL65605.1 hypothetical protein FKV68_30295 [Sinorhizobium mexicanum]
MEQRETTLLGWVIMRNVHLAAIIIILSPFDTFAASGDYSCSNGEFEIHCNSYKCESEEDFTPAGGVVNTSTKDMSVCAYNGCWEGKADSIISSQGHIIAYSDRLQGNNPGLHPTSAAIVINRETLGATLNAFGFQSPMSCSLK